jgi:putative intracellular protease/amidase
MDEWHCSNAGKVRESPLTSAANGRPREEPTMKIAILLYEGMTALDAIGPYDVLRQIPGAEVVFVGNPAGVKHTEEQPLGLVADRALAEVPAADVLLVPGGFGQEQVMRDETTLKWVRAVHATTQWTTSVCTGSLILAAAGLLRGLKATTHWAALERLREFGAEPVAERVVEQGKIITSAGVSAGIDMGLRLVARIAGDDMAQAIQLGIEYDPAPPFDAGSPRTAPAHVVQLVRDALELKRARYVSPPA